MRKFILGLDEGTTSLRSVLFDVEAKQIVDIEGKLFKQYYPFNGWVEQDANEIYNKILKTSKALLKKHNVTKEELLGIGITNQRETVVAWNRTTGEPLCKAIVWQCRRTSHMIKNLSTEAKQKIKEKTGLIANPYFSASKMKWILDNVSEAKKLAKNGNLCFGTIDSFLAFKLTGNFVTDTTNASRTCLMNIKTLDWDDELLAMFKIPKNSLPKILPCDTNFGNCKKLLGSPIVSMIGDQQSSMIGQGATNYGDAKVTYGTGAFILANVGQENGRKSSNLLTTVAHTLGNKTEYAIEGSIFSACSAINWLKENLGLYENVEETSKMAKSLKDNDGVYLIPAFTGLGAPHWKDDARACIFGISFKTNKNHLVRATLESMVYSTKEIIDEMKACGLRLKFFSADGGGSKNEFVLQFLADMLNHDVVKSKQSEATVLGAIYVAMLSLGLIQKKDIKTLTQSNLVYSPQITESERRKFYDGWKKAIKKL